MRLDRFALATTTNDLSQEASVRDVADLLEFRMDEAEDPIAQLSEYDGDLPILATNRAESAGGSAPETGRLDRLVAGAEFAAVEMVDVELETARETEQVLDELRANDVDIVVSHHAFEATPELETLRSIFRECARYGDVAKVATYAEEYADSLSMIRAVYDATKEGLCVAGISMGQVGSHTRAVAPLYGSKLGYAPLASDSTEYAPGQIPVRELAAMIETFSGSD